MPEVYLRFNIFKLTGRWSALSHHNHLSRIPSELHTYRHNRPASEMIKYWDELFYEDPEIDINADTD